MGQIFNACAYDTKKRTTCVMAADKFHANCYSFSGTVLAIHYLLRKKSYNVMWGGDYVVIDDAIESFSAPEQLLGISTYLNYENFRTNNKNIESKSYYNKVQFIEENSKLWKDVDVWDKAKEYFDWDNTQSVTYSGYLLNCTKKLAVDLKDYYAQSRCLSSDGTEMAIDLIPVLTETGGGTAMALFDGFDADSTIELTEEWCGDLLQIVDKKPEDYQLISCCFAEIGGRIRYCYYTYGVNKNSYLKADETGRLFKANHFNVFMVPGKKSHYIKVEKDSKGIRAKSAYEL